MVVGEFTQETDLLVIGGGPGGYHAAFRAAENGIHTTLVESAPKLGGVCLRCGCIPSKTYLSMAETLHLAGESEKMGISFGKPKLDVDKIRNWKNEVVDKLAGGVASLAKKHKVEVVHGLAEFEDNKTVAIREGDVSRIKFKKCIIATGSKPISIPSIQVDSPNVLDSTTALDLENVPKSLLVMGGGYIGLELGQVMASFGSKVTVVEMLPNLMAGADSDLTRPLVKRLKEQFEAICLETKVTGMKETKTGIKVSFEGKNVPENTTFEKVLVSVGRTPNTTGLNPEKAGVTLDEKGFVVVNDQFQTSANKIYAIGDVIGNPMLAHKALHEGHIVADIIAGKDAIFDPRSIPAVVFTDPEIAWTGYTEDEAKAAGLNIIVKKMPLQASGRAVAIGRTEGLVKMIFDKETHRVLGVGLAGPHVGEMIAEGSLAIEMGAVAYDVASTVHPHPTISEMISDVARTLT